MKVNPKLKNCAGASEMAQRVKSLATKPNDLNLVPGTHMVEGENRLSSSVSWFPYVHAMWNVHTLINTHKIKYNKNLL